MVPVNLVIARPGNDKVGPRTPLDAVITGPAIEEVTATQAPEGIVACTPEQVVTEFAAGQGVGIVARAAVHVPACRDRAGKAADFHSAVHIGKHGSRVCRVFHNRDGGRDIQCIALLQQAQESRAGAQETSGKPVQVIAVACRRGVSQAAGHGKGQQLVQRVTVAPAGGAIIPGERGQGAGIQGLRRQ